MLVDSHCHLDFPALIEELDDVVARAHAAGVERMVTICTTPSGFERVRGVAETYDSVMFAAGMHPLHAHEEPFPTVEQIVAWAEHPKMVGVGEAGLDYHYRKDTVPLQRESFEIQIEAARQTGLPLIIHSRDADADMAEILEREHAAGAFSCVMHCYSSGAELAETALGLGFYLSMSGVATFKSADAVRAVFQAAPLDRILVETDAPYLAPPPHRGKRNEPAYVRHTAEIGAKLFDLSLEDFGARTTENFDRLFKKAAAYKRSGAKESAA